MSLGMHDSLRWVAVRPRAIRCFTFLANSSAIDKKRRLAAHLDSHCRLLAGVVLTWSAAKNDRSDPLAAGDTQAQLNIVLKCTLSHPQACHIVVRSGLESRGEACGSAAFTERRALPSRSRFVRGLEHVSCRGRKVSRNPRGMHCITPCGRWQHGRGRSALPPTHEGYADGIPRGVLSRKIQERRKSREMASTV